MNGKRRGGQSGCGNRRGRQKTSAIIALIFWSHDELSLSCLRTAYQSCPDPEVEALFILTFQKIEENNFSSGKTEK